MRSRCGYTFHVSSNVVRLIMRQLDTLAHATAGVAPRRRRPEQVITHFYDRPDGALLKAGWQAYALLNDTGHTYGMRRMRRPSAAWQSWRTWSGETQTAQLSQTAFAALPELPGKTQRMLEQCGNLEACLSIEVQRSTWQLPAFEGVEIEVLLEIGHINTAGHRIDMTELTLIASDRHAQSALLSLARRLHQTAPLFLQAESAVLTALRVLFDTTCSAQKYIAPETAPRCSASDLSRANLAAIVGHWLSNQAGARDSTDIEYVHQFRIALRRLNAACKLFAPWLEPIRQARLATELRWLRSLLGGVRDWDVFVETTLPALCSASEFPPHTAAEFKPAFELRDEARNALRTALNSTRYATLMLDLLEWLAIMSPQHDGLRSAPRGLRKHAKKSLHKYHLSSASIAHFTRLPEAEQHRIRLQAKRMRYSIELLAPLLSSKSCKSTSRAYAAMLDALGRANDAAVATRLVEQLTLRPETRGYAYGWLAARRQHCIAQVERQLPGLQVPKLRS